MGVCVATLPPAFCGAKRVLESGPLLPEEAWVEPCEAVWPSLSEPQSLYLLGTSILWKDGNSWLGCPAAALGE